VYVGLYDQILIKNPKKETDIIDVFLSIIIIIIIVHRVQYEETTQCIENSAVRESYSETVQNVEIISLISDS